MGPNNSRHGSFRMRKTLVTTSWRGISSSGQHQVLLKLLEWKKSSKHAVVFYLWFLTTRLMRFMSGLSLNGVSLWKKLVDLNKYVIKQRGETS